MPAAHRIGWLLFLLVVRSCCWSFDSINTAPASLTSGKSAAKSALNGHCDQGEHFDGGLMRCVSCYYGKYGLGGTSCADCPRSYFQDAFGRSGCKECPKGKHQPRVGSASCAKVNRILPRCGKGYFVAPRAAACLICPLGLYQPHINVSSLHCKQCEAGRSVNR
jgi:hypothetical protein